MALCFGAASRALDQPSRYLEGSIRQIDDIDEHEQTRALLDAMQREKQVLFDHAMVGIVYLRDRHLTRCNRHFEVMLGYEPGELLR